MIDLLGLLYDVGKDIKKYLEWAEEEKLVDFNWPATSGFQAMAKNDRLSLLWSRPENIASRASVGYEIVYEIDKPRHIKRKLVLKDGSVLVGKRKN